MWGHDKMYTTYSHNKHEPYYTTLKRMHSYMAREDSMTIEYCYHTKCYLMYTVSKKDCTLLLFFFF